MVIVLLNFVDFKFQITPRVGIYTRYEVRQLFELIIFLVIA